ncbi:MAG: ParB/RepB/Spo0J family partition protein [Flavobacteriales bacterium]|nr:ParB/RepB/Spo0J family partition protein [Flavobacteriales bacterium]
MTKKRGLGRGLSALLDEPATDLGPRPTLAAPRSVGAVAELPIAEIEPNPFQPRTTFNNEALVELATSIRNLGVIQPVTVRRVAPDRYQLISGERRFRAAQAAGLTQIPAYIRVANDEAMLEMALVENIQREDLDAIEVAISFKRLTDEVGLTQEQLSEKVGKDRTTVTNYLRLLKLPAEIQLGIRQRQISMGHARALITIADPARQLELYRRIVESQLSVRQVEELARHMPSRHPRPSNPTAPRTRTDIGHQLGERLGSKVVVKQDNIGKGRIEIAFTSEEDLQRLVSRLA